MIVHEAWKKKKGREETNIVVNRPCVWCFVFSHFIILLLWVVTCDRRSLSYRVTVSENVRPYYNSFVRWTPLIVVSISLQRNRIEYQKSNGLRRWILHWNRNEYLRRWNKQKANVISYAYLHVVDRQQNLFFFNKRSTMHCCVDHLLELAKVNKKIWSSLSLALFIEITYWNRNTSQDSLNEGTSKMYEDTHYTSFVNCDV